MQSNPATETLFVDDIIVSNRHRPVVPEAVKALAASMADIGLRTPITIRSPNDSECYLVAGRHRLEAAKLLGWEKIECFVLNCSEDEAEMWEISENLHRAELTELQRSDQTARWIDLNAEVRKVSAPGGVQPRDKGIRKAADELRVDEKEVRNRVKIASLTPEAKSVATERGLDDNQSALLEAARLEPSRQADYLRVRQPSNYPQDDVERSIKWRRSFERVWNDAPSMADREWAMSWIDRPIMDGAA